MPTPPRALDHRTALAAEQDAFAELAEGTAGALPVPACGSWTVQVLVRHLAAVHRWAALAATAEPSGALPDMRPVFRATAATDYPSAAAELRAVLTEPDRPCVTLDGAGTAGWWTRRQLHETLIHRFDLAAAAGAAWDADPAVAADCVAEVLDTMQPRQVRLGRMAPPAAGIRLTAPHGAWSVGPAPAAEVHGEAAALALLLWRRIPLDDERLTVTGDRGVADAVLAEALVP